MLNRLRRFRTELFAYTAKGINVFAAFLVTLLIARLSGPATVGEYALAIQTAQLFGVLACAGFDTLLLRRLSGDVREGRLAEARGLVRISFGRLLPRIAAVGGAYVGLVMAFERWAAIDQNMATMLLGGAYMALLVLSIFLMVVIRSTGRPVAGQFVDGHQSVVLAMFLGGFWWLAVAPTSTQVISITVGAMAWTVFLMAVFVWSRARHWPRDPVPIDPPRFGQALPFLSMAIVMALSQWLPLVLVEVQMSSTEVGLYRVAFQFAMTASVIAITGSNVVGPALAGDIRTGRMDLAWRRYRRATLLSLLLSAPLLLPMLLVPEWLVAIVFGPGFEQAAAAMRWLALGQLAALLVGPIGMLQSMAGKERVALMIGVAGLVLLGPLMFLLIPPFGLAGAAAAYALTVALRAILSFAHARRTIRPPAPAP